MIQRHYNTQLSALFATKGHAVSEEKTTRFRPLTAGEIALATRVFGTSICYDKVGITATAFMPFQPKGTAMAPDGNLYMYGCYHDDYAQQPPMTQAHFIHEMTHVWQKQNGVLDPIKSALKLNLAYRFNYNAAYFYTLDAARDLTSYNMEQQATIVQDYFLRTFCGHAHDSGKCQTNGGWDNTRALYEAVLKNFLANPHYARKVPPNSAPPAPPSV